MTIIERINFLFFIYSNDNHHDMDLASDAEPFDSVDGDIEMETNHDNKNNNEEEEEEEKGEDAEDANFKVVAVPSDSNSPQSMRKYVWGYKTASYVRTVDNRTGAVKIWDIASSNEMYAKFKKYHRSNKSSITTTIVKDNTRRSLAETFELSSSEDEYVLPKKPPTLKRDKKGNTSLFDDDNDDESVKSNESDGDKKMKASVSSLSSKKKKTYSESDDDDDDDTSAYSYEKDDVDYEFNGHGKNNDDTKNDDDIDDDDDDDEIDDDDDDDDNNVDDDDDVDDVEIDNDGDDDDVVNGNDDKMKRSKKGDTSKKGKTKLERVDDDSEEDIFGGEGREDEVSILDSIQNAAAAMQQGDSRIISVTEPMYDPVKNVVHYICFMQDQGGVFYVKAQLQSLMMTARYKALQTPFNAKGSRVLPSYCNTWTNYKVIKTPCSNHNEWARRGMKKKTSDGTYFILTLPISEEGTLHDVLDHISKEYIRKIYKNQKGSNRAGKYALEYAKSTQGGKPLDQGLYGFLVKSKGAGNPETAQSVMAKEMNDHFCSEIDFVYDCHLDEFLIDFDIKSLLINLIGAKSWDDVDDDTRKLCYRDYPRKPLPNWDTIMNENY
jgi:hypothetical protein